MSGTETTLSSQSILSTHTEDYSRYPKRYACQGHLTKWTLSLNKGIINQPQSRTFKETLNPQMLSNNTLSEV